MILPIVSINYVRVTYGTFSLFILFVKAHINK